MEEECFPAISMNTITGHHAVSTSSSTTVILKRDSLVPEDDCPEIKDEPISMPASPCVSSQSSCNIIDDKSTITMVSPQSLHFAKAQFSHTSDSEEDEEEEEYYQVHQSE